MTLLRRGVTLLRGLAPDKWSSSSSSIGGSGAVEGARRTSASAVHSAGGATHRAKWLLVSLRDEYPKRGFWGTVQAVRMGKVGMFDRCLVGADEFGNRYFEDRAQWYGRDRWVEYADYRNSDPAGLPPEWHAWLHHSVDDTPTAPDTRWRRAKFQKEPSVNMSGTPRAYAPRNSPRSPNFVGHLAASNIEAWQPRATEAKAATTTMTTAAASAEEEEMSKRARRRQHRMRDVVSGRAGSEDDPRLDLP